MKYPLDFYNELGKHYNYSIIYPPIISILLKMVFKYKKNFSYLKDIYS